MDHLWNSQNDFLDVGQVRCFHEEVCKYLAIVETPTFWKGDTDELNAKTKGSDRIPAKRALSNCNPNG